MNPCRCGYLGDPARACSKAPACGRTYSARISGPMLDRFDLIIEVPEVDGKLLLKGTPGETSQQVASRVKLAREFACQHVLDEADALPSMLQLETGRMCQSARSTKMPENCWNWRLIVSHSQQEDSIGSCGWRGRLPILMAAQKLPALTLPRHLPSGDAVAGVRRMCFLNGIPCEGCDVRT